MRPADWHVLDLGGDPVPGDPGQMRVLSRELSRVAEDAARAGRDVRSIAGDGPLMQWLGEAGTEFKAAVGEFPTQLGKVAESYGRASSAVSTWAESLESAQSQADRALAQGREAREDLARAQAALSATQSAAGSASQHADGLQHPTSSAAPPPDPEQVRAAVRNAQQAQARVSSASGGVDAAQQRLELAKKLAAQAAHLRDDAGDRASREIRSAADAGIAPTSFWDKVKSAAAKVWKVLIVVAKIVVAVLGIVVLIIGGPLAWVVFAAALLVLADTVVKWAQGRASAMDLVWALLDCIPGTKGITTAARLLKGAKGIVSGLAKGRSLVTSMTTAVRGIAAGVKGVAAGVKVIAKGLPDAVRDVKVGVAALPGGGGVPVVDISGVRQVFSQAADAKAAAGARREVASPPHADSSAPDWRLDSAEDIARGHAVSHQSDFPPGADLVDIAKRTMAHPVESKPLARGRTAYLGDDGTIVVHDPYNEDGGTMFKPRNPKRYWEGSLE